MKLTIKDIAKYGATNLVWKSKNDNIRHKPLGYISVKNNLNLVVESLYSDMQSFKTSNIDVKTWGYRPIMRPLSQLTEEITHDGETFVPIVELAKMAISEFKKYKVWSSDFLKECQIEDNYISFVFYKITYVSDFYIYLNGDRSNLINVTNQELLFQKLYEWHFWTGDQSYFDNGILIKKV